MPFAGTRCITIQCRCGPVTESATSGSESGIDLQSQLFRFKNRSFICNLLQIHQFRRRFSLNPREAESARPGSVPTSNDFITEVCQGDAAVQDMATESHNIEVSGSDPFVIRDIRRKRAFERSISVPNLIGPACHSRLCFGRHSYAQHPEQDRRRAGSERQQAGVIRIQRRSVGVFGVRRRRR